MSRKAVKRFSWKQLLIANTAGGLIMPLIVLWVSRTPDWHGLWRTLVFSMAYSWSVGTTATAAFVIAGPYIACHRRKAAWTLVFTVLAVSAVLGCAAGTTIVSLLTWGAERWLTIYWSSLRFCLPIALGFGVVFGVVEDVQRRLRTTTLELRTRELERERAEKLATEARLASLQSRVHPHFLFNALNSISSLIRENPERAERLIERMASILRYSLDANVVSLAQEMKIVRDYVDVEQARFGTRLRFESEVPAELADVELPAMSIQTLVENSVKYAVSTSREGAAICVSAEAGSDAVRISVSDDGPGFSPEAVPAGHGLDLLQSRLETLFGDGAGLEFHPKCVAIRIPAKVAVRS